MCWISFVVVVRSEVKDANHWVPFLLEVAAGTAACIAAAEVDGCLLDALHAVNVTFDVRKENAAWPQTHCQLINVFTRSNVSTRRTVFSNSFLRPTTEYQSFDLVMVPQQPNQSFNSPVSSAGYTSWLPRRDPSVTCSSTVRPVCTFFLA